MTDLKLRVARDRLSAELVTEFQQRWGHLDSWIRTMQECYRDPETVSDLAELHYRADACERVLKQLGLM